MLGILNLLFGSFTRKLEGLISVSMLTVVQQLIAKSRKALLIVISSFVFAALLAAGVIIMVLEASAQYDTRGVIYFSALLTSASILSAISLAVLTFILWPRSKPIIPAAAFQSQPSARPNSPLEDTLAMLLNEVVKYVKDKNKPEPEPETDKPSDASFKSSQNGYNPDTRN